MLSPRRTEDDGFMGLARTVFLPVELDEDAAAFASAFALRVASIAAKRAGSVRWNVDVLTRLMLCVDLRLIQPSDVPGMDDFVLLVAVEAAAGFPTTVESIELAFSVEAAAPGAAPCIAPLWFESLRINVRFRCAIATAPRPLPLAALALA